MRKREHKDQSMIEKTEMQQTEVIVSSFKREDTWFSTKSSLNRRDQTAIDNS